MMKMYVNSLQTDWDTYLPRLLWAYRSAYHETLNDTPYFCLFGRDPVQPLDLVCVNQDPAWKSDELPQWRRQQSALFRATRHLVEKQLIDGQYKTARTKSSQTKIEFEPADSVWVYQHFRKTNDPDDKRIKSKQGDNTYRIYLPSHPDRIVLINVDRLKKFQGHWSRPNDDEIPSRLANDENDPSRSESDPELADAQLDSNLLPPASFVDRIQYSDGDVAYANTDSPLTEILNKR
ncbi:hypothetical protein AeMF1_021191 [Aphanomyces euteiches]|nr:hypothetical protein AeMF1_021191 [Aphanomyces euteiches]KAH9184815.1 hypothetical protein AeNC1_013210 [Aphanomyces euteiches]